MNAIPWKRLLPVFAAIALFYALSLVYFSPMLEGKEPGPARHQAMAGHGQGGGRAPRRHGRRSLWTGSMFSGMPAYQISVKWTSNLLSLRRQAVPRLPAAPGQLPLPLPDGHVRAAADPEGGSLALAGGCHRLRLQQLLLRDPAGGAHQQGQRHRLHAHGAGRGVPACTVGACCWVPPCWPSSWAGSDDEPRAGDLLPGDPVGACSPGGRVHAVRGKDRGRFRETVRPGCGGRRAGRALQPGRVVEHLGIR
jgi:hypothetical protein